MIKLKESYGFGFRLFDDQTGEYVRNTADNRSEALFCALLESEAKKPYKDEPFRLHTVSETAKIFFDFLKTSETPHLVDERLVREFVRGCDAVWEINGLKDDENFQKLVFCVLNDQRDENKATNAYDIENFSRKYEYMNNEIFGKEEKQEEVL